MIFCWGNVCVKRGWELVALIGGANIGAGGCRQYVGIIAMDIFQVQKVG